MLGRTIIAGLLLVGGFTTATWAASADQCEFNKLKLAAKYGACRLSTAAKAVKRASVPDFSRCDAKFLRKWSSVEARAGGLCPSQNDQTPMHAFISQHTNDVAGALAGGALPPPARLLVTGQLTSYGAGSDGDLQRGVTHTFTDNGDGTVTDHATGLMWEKKSDDDSVHDLDNLYTWADSHFFPPDTNGTMFTEFLSTLNSGSGFAGYTDWRIPNRNELQSILNLERVDPATYPAFHNGCVPGCSVTTCSCTSTEYWHWSSTTYPGEEDLAYDVAFYDGDVDSDIKYSSFPVRAVRGGP